MAQLRRPAALAPLSLDDGSELSSPDEANRPPPSLSDSGRFNFGHLQIDAQGVVPAPSHGDGSSTVAADDDAFVADTSGFGSGLDFRELQGLEIIGRGASGFVRRAEHTPSGMVLAIKEITVSDETRRLQIFKEISTLLCSGDAPNLVHYHGARSYDGAIQIAMEYMDGGSLGDLLQAIGPISEDCIAAIAEQALHALTDLRDRHLVHRDLKPQNILLNLRGQVKVSDFGCVAELQDSFGKCGTFVGTVPYMSPERIHGEEYSYASDVWSFGLTIVECALGHFPYARAQGYWGILQAHGSCMCMCMCMCTLQCASTACAPTVHALHVHCACARCVKGRQYTYRLWPVPAGGAQGALAFASRRRILGRAARLCVTLLAQGAPPHPPATPSHPPSRPPSPSAPPSPPRSQPTHPPQDPNERPSARKLLGHPFILRRGSANSATSGFSLKRFLCSTFEVTPEPSPQRAADPASRWGAPDAAAAGESGAAREVGMAAGADEASISDDLRAELRAALSANSQLRAELDWQQQLVSQVTPSHLGDPSTPDVVPSHFSDTCRGG